MATHPKTSMARSNKTAPKTASRTPAKSPGYKHAGAGSMPGRAAGPKTKAAATGTGKSTKTSTPKTAERQSRNGRRARTKGAAREAAPSNLAPIRKKQTRAEIIAGVAAESGTSLSTVESVARSLSRTLTRHLIRGGSGRVEVPYLGAALWRGRTAAQKARRMTSPILNGRTVTVKARVATRRRRGYERIARCGISWRVRRGRGYPPYSLDVIPLPASPGDPFQLLLDSLGKARHRDVAGFARRGCIVDVPRQLSPAPGIAPAPEAL